MSNVFHIFSIVVGVGEKRADGENTHGPGHNRYPSESAGWDRLLWGED